MKRHSVFLLALLAVAIATISGLVGIRPSAAGQAAPLDKAPATRPSAAPLPHEAVVTSQTPSASAPVAVAQAPRSFSPPISRQPVPPAPWALDPAVAPAGRPSPAGGRTATARSTRSVPPASSGGSLSMGSPVQAAGSTPASAPIQGVAAGLEDGAGTVLEIDPGVPLPAAMIAPAAAEPAPVAAAREQVADSFVNEVESALAGTEDSATPAAAAADNASDVYYQSLQQANETYRALYGDEAFNRQSIRAVMEAGSSE